MATDRTDPPEPRAVPNGAAPGTASRPARRRLQNAFIVAFLGYQLVAPLDYYLGEQGYDERFSWRMFSNVRMHDCALELSETRQGVAGPEERPIDAGRELHVAWYNILNRYRPAVVRKFLESRCDKTGVVQAHFVRRCRDTDDTPLPVQRVDYDCGDGTLHEENPTP